MHISRQSNSTLLPICYHTLFFSYNGLHVPEHLSIAGASHISLCMPSDAYISKFYTYLPPCIKLYSSLLIHNAARVSWHLNVTHLPQELSLFTATGQHDWCLWFLIISYLTLSVACSMTAVSRSDWWSVIWAGRSSSGRTLWPFILPVWLNFVCGHTGATTTLFNS